MLAVLDSVVAEEPVGAAVVALPEPPVDPVPVVDPVLGEEPDPPPLEDPCTTTVPCMKGWIEQM